MRKNSFPTLGFRIRRTITSPQSPRLRWSLIIVKYTHNKNGSEIKGVRPIDSSFYCAQRTRPEVGFHLSVPSRG